MNTHSSSSADLLASSPRATLGRLVLLLVAAALTAIAAVPPLLVDDLPDPLATRWGMDGVATSSVATAILVALSIVVTLVAAALLVAVALDRRERRSPGRPLVAGTVALVGAVIAAPVAMILVANDGAADWRSVAGPPGWQIIGVVLMSLVAGTIAAWAASLLPERVEPLSRTEPLDLPEAVHVSWSRHLRVRWLVVVSAVSLVVGVILTITIEAWWIGLVVAVSGLPGGLLAQVVVIADSRGLAVGYGPFGWPRTRLPIERIEAASAIDLVPSEWGGWGYRGSLTLFRQAAVVLRGGPGLRVDLVDGRRFAVSIDDPETAAAVLTREIGRR